MERKMDQTLKNYLEKREAYLEAVKEYEREHGPVEPTTTSKVVHWLRHKLLPAGYIKEQELKKNDPERYNAEKIICYTDKLVNKTSKYLIKKKKIPKRMIVALGQIVPALMIMNMVWPDLKEEVEVRIKEVEEILSTDMAGEGLALMTQIFKKEKEKGKSK